MAIGYVQLAFGDATFSPADDGVWDDTIDTDDFGLGIPKPCVLEILCENNQGGHPNEIGVRELNSALARVFDVHEAEAGGETHMTLLVQTDADGLFEAYSEDVSDTTHHVVGYFTGVSYTEYFAEYQADDFADWVEEDLSGTATASRVYEIVCENHFINSPNTLGVREVGSGIARNISVHEAEDDGRCGYSTFVKGDAAATVELYASNNAQSTFTLVGEFDDAVDFTEAQDTLDAAGDAGWENEVLIGFGVPASAVIATLCFNNELGAENEMGTRDDESGIDRKWDEHEAEGGFNTGFRLCVTAGADGNRTIEIYEEDTSECTLYHHGWFSDAVGVETFTKTFTFDALLQKEGTQEFTFDGLLQKEFTKTFTFDGILILQKTKDFTLDALLQKNLTQAFTFDGLLQKAFIKDFTLDALLGKTFTKEFTFDGILILQKTKEFTLDALLQKNLTKAFTFDAFLQKNLTQAFTFDGLLQKAFTKTFTFDAFLQKNLTKTFTLDALLQKNLTKTFTFDGLLQKSFIKTFTLDALLQKAFVQEFTFDTLLQKNLTKTFTLDGLLQKAFTKTFTFDGILLKSATQTFTLDALLQKNLTKTFTFDAILDFVVPIEVVAGTFPPTLRIHYTASMPMRVTIRRPIHSAVLVNRLIRRAILATIDTQALIRRRISESFTVKRPIITPQFKELMKSIYEFLKEEQT